jgi:hypothetical protein
VSVVSPLRSAEASTAPVPEPASTSAVCRP